MAEMGGVKGVIADSRASPVRQVPLGVLHISKLLFIPASASLEVLPACVPFEPPCFPAQPSVVAHQMAVPSVIHPCKSLLTWGVHV